MSSGPTGRSSSREGHHQVADLEREDEGGGGGQQTQHHRGGHGGLAALQQLCEDPQFVGAVRAWFSGPWWGLPAVCGRVGPPSFARPTVRSRHPARPVTRRRGPGRGWPVPGWPGRGWPGRRPAWSQGPCARARGPSRGSGRGRRGRRSPRRTPPPVRRPSDARGAAAPRLRGPRDDMRPVFAELSPRMPVRSSFGSHAAVTPGATTWANAGRALRRPVARALSVTASTASQEPEPR